MDDILPPVSFVVIGRNEGDRLVRCLASIRQMDYPAERVEVIYVDTDSADGSADRARALGVQVVVVRPEHPSAAAARNAGWSIAQHDLVHFLDGDTELNKDWLRVAIQAMECENAACVFGRREEIAPDATIYNFWMHHDWYTPPGLADSCAGDALFRRSVLKKAGGYDEALIAGEEPDLCYRIRSRQNMDIVSIDHPMTLHDINMTTFRQYWKRCTRTGHAYAEVGGRHKGMTKWRRARWRNLGHALAPFVAVVVSVALRTPWPVIVWASLLLMAIVRNAWRMRQRVGAMGDALRYSAHHYLCKFPATVGQCAFWWRRWMGRTPQPLIEYR